MATVKERIAQLRVSLDRSRAVYGRLKIELDDETRRPRRLYLLNEMRAQRGLMAYVKTNLARLESTL